MSQNTEGTLMQKFAGLRSNPINASFNRGAVVIRALAFAAMMPLPVLAQSTPADILAALETPTSELEQLMEVLEGTNEEKALIAMRLMLGSGDAAMERLALRTGLTSTSGVTRGVALEAFMNTQPTLMVFAKADTEGEAGPGFKSWIQRTGSLSSATTGSFPIVVGPYLTDKNCFSGSDARNRCYSRLGGTEFSFYATNSWGTVRLNDSGELVGTISYGNGKDDTTGPISLTIPLLGQLQ